MGHTEGAPQLPPHPPSMPCLVRAHQIRHRINAPTPSNIQKVRTQPPTICHRLTLMLRIAPLQIHAALVVPNRSNLFYFLNGQPNVGQCRQVVDFRLDRLRSHPNLLNQRRNHTAHGFMRQIPQTGQLEQRNPVLVRNRLHPRYLLRPRLNPARRTVHPMIVLRKLVPRTNIPMKEATVIHHTGG